MLLSAANDSQLLVVDVQDRLMPAIADSDMRFWKGPHCWSGRRGVSTSLLTVSEQYPSGLGGDRPTGRRRT